LSVPLYPPKRRMHYFDRHHLQNRVLRWCLRIGSVTLVLRAKNYPRKVTLFFPRKRAGPSTLFSQLKSTPSKQRRGKVTTLQNEPGHRARENGQQPTPPPGEKEHMVPPSSTVESSAPTAQNNDRLEPGSSRKSCSRRSKHRTKKRKPKHKKEAEPTAPSQTQTTPTLNHINLDRFIPKTKLLALLPDAQAVDLHT